MPKVISIQGEKYTTNPQMWNGVPSFTRVDSVKFTSSSIPDDAAGAMKWLFERNPDFFFGATINFDDGTTARIPDPFEFYQSTHILDRGEALSHVANQFDYNLGRYSSVIDFPKEYQLVTLYRTQEEFKNGEYEVNAVPVADLYVHIRENENRPSVNEEYDPSDLYTILDIAKLYPLEYAKEGYFYPNSNAHAQVGLIARALKVSNAELSDLRYPDDYLYIPQKDVLSSDEYVKCAQNYRAIRKEVREAPYEVQYYDFDKEGNKIADHTAILKNMDSLDDCHRWIIENGIVPFSYSIVQRVDLSPSYQKGHYTGGSFSLGGAVSTALLEMKYENKSLTDEEAFALASKREIDDFCKRYDTTFGFAIKNDVDIDTVDPAKVVTFDLETTGFGKNAEIVSISIVNGYGTTLLDSLVKPVHNERWDEASKINGIYPEDVEDAPTFKEIAPKALAVLNSSELIVGYNHEKFDIPFINNLLVQNNMPRIDGHIPTYDVMLKDKELRGLPKVVNLGRCAQAHEINTEGLSLHGSLVDTLVTANILARQIKRDDMKYFCGQALDVAKGIDNKQTVTNTQTQQKPDTPHNTPRRPV